MPSPANVDFYFSPTYPWAWRTALWMRQVAAEGLVQVNWKLQPAHYQQRARLLPRRARLRLQSRDPAASRPASRWKPSRGEAVHGSGRRAARPT